MEELYGDRPSNMQSQPNSEHKINQNPADAAPADAVPNDGNGPLKHTTAEADSNGTKLEETQLSSSHHDVCNTDRKESFPPMDAQDKRPVDSVTVLNTTQLETHILQPDAEGKVLPGIGSGTAGSEPQDTSMDGQNGSNGSQAHGGAEWEADSSPYESSSDSSDTSSSDDESADDYQMLDPAEQARRLMEDDAISDDEGGTKGAKGSFIRSHNEVVDETVVKPDITITPEMKIEELGKVETIVENVALIKAKITGEYHVLETQSLLCLADRKVIGVVSETLGRVQEPLYCLRFQSHSSMDADGVTIGTTVFYVPGHSTFVFTRALQAVKGSDASNIHDEEVGVDEIEFSDDEAEAEYKRNLKLQKQAKRAGKTNGNPHPSTRNRMQDGVGRKTSMNYDDDAPQEELYTPLARPANFHEMGANATVEAPGGTFDRGYRGGRGRGDRGRIRGRGGRGGGRSDHHRLQHALPDRPDGGIPSQSQSPLTSPSLHFGQPGLAPVQSHQFHFQNQHIQQPFGGYPYPGQQTPSLQYPQHVQGPLPIQNTQFWPPAAQQFHPSQSQPTSHGNSYPFQQGAGQLPQADSFPTGAAINPLFFQNQQPHNNLQR